MKHLRQETETSDFFLHSGTRQASETADNGQALPGSARNARQLRSFHRRQSRVHHQPSPGFSVQEFKKDKEFLRWLEQQAGSEKHAERMGSRIGSATAIVEAGPQGEERGERPREKALLDGRRESA